MNINIKLAKKAAETMQEKDQALSYLNINAALHQAAIEFKGGKKSETLIHDCNK